ncbi:AraC family transcriptional regulator [Dictyobacter aurantiacus]|uniref:AraC family transcriptional regulator n=1 Tax=Dictyobacter aurantiacus TaxID=1936993 RepID=A0A401ZB69_9CHLR|nr:AraC family transcriptional regulator [Dictyobacter aurantiacus]GCE04076.1 AraC family transcriptional regulator [Dictyobacter aurantiacus]
MVEISASVPRQRFMELNNLALSIHLGSFASEMLGWGFFEPRYWRNYLHTHSCFEVCYAFAGEGQFRVGSEMYTVGNGDVFIARPGVSHEIISAEAQPLGIYFWTYTLTPGAQDAALSDASGKNQSIDNLLTAFMSSPCVVSRRTSSMLRTLELLTEEVAARHPGYPHIINGLVCKLLVDTARAAVDEEALTRSEQPVSRQPDQAVAQMIERYLRDNYWRPISIRDLAAQVHLSERHTSRLFQKVMGETIMSYLTTLRLDIAAQLLLDRQLPVKEVALTVGYPDVRYFITLFRRRKGLTPAAFRQHGGTTFL